MFRALSWPCAPAVCLRRLAPACLLKWLSTLTRGGASPHPLWVTLSPTTGHTVGAKVGQSKTWPWETGWPACPRNHADDTLPLVRFRAESRALGGKRRPGRVTKALCQATRGCPSVSSPDKTDCFHPEGIRAQGAGLHWEVEPWGAMESLTESGVLWSLLLEQDSQPLQWYLKKFPDTPAGAELCFGHGSEEIPAVSVPPNPSGPE